MCVCLSCHACVAHGWPLGTELIPSKGTGLIPSEATGSWMPWGQLVLGLWGWLSFQKGKAVRERNTLLFLIFLQRACLPG